MCADGGVFYWRGKGTTGQLAGVSAGHALGMAQTDMPQTCNKTFKLYFSKKVKQQ